MDFGISGKCALVLGASRGLGAAIAAGLAAEGVTVLAAARSIDAMAQDDRIRPLKVDLADVASVAALIETVKAEGGVDILVNNGGGPVPGSALGQSAQGWSTAFSSMAVALFTITDGLIGGMIEAGWGRVITIGSSGIAQPIPNLAISNGVRSAVSGWSKTLAGEVSRHGVTVNMILPGRIDTDRVRSLDASRAERTGISVADVQSSSRTEIPAGRYGTPEEFAAVATFLASRQASYITGSAIRVDGGMIKGL